MKTSLIVGVIILLGVFIFFLPKKDTEIANIPPASNIEGCYIAGTVKDVYTLNIQSKEGENFSGSLAFKNFEKDSSSGTFVGTYINGILLGEYAFQSEGMDSVMQVIFKRVGDDFVRGYGDVDSATGSRFTDLNNITYDTSSVLAVFKKGACPE